MRLVIRHIVLLLGCCYGSLLSAQQLAYRHFGINEGLPHSELYAICQAPDKTLWISTDNGLSHYDGSSFTNYNPKTVTGSNYVLHTAFLPDGRLLVNSYRKGLCFLDNGKFVKSTVITEGFSYAAEQMGAIYTLTYDTLNRCIWAITSGHTLLRFALKGNTLTVKDMWRQYYNNWVHVDTLARTTYICNQNGLNRYSDGKLLPVCDALKGKTITKAMPYDAQHLLLATENSLLVYNKVQNTVMNEIHLEGGNLHYEYFMYDMQTKLVWLPDHTGGVKVFDLVQPQKILYHLLPEVNVNYLFADGLGNTWCCSYGSGLFQFPQLNIVNYNAAEGLKDNYVTHITGNNPLQVACLKSYYQFDTSAGRFKVILETGVRKPNNKSMVLLDGQPGFLNAIHILDKKGKILYNNKSVMYDIAVLNKDTLLLGGFRGLTMLDRRYQILNNTFPVPDVNVNKIWIGKDTIILATSAGVYVRSYGRWQQFNEKHGLADNIVQDVKVANDKIYATGRSGMSIIHADGRVSRYDKVKTGNTSIMGLEIDNWGGIWMATGNGLYLDYRDKRYQFDQHDGLITNDITEIYTVGDKVYTGTTQGLSAINLPALYNSLGQTTPCLLQVSLAVVKGSAIKQIAHNMELSPDENDIQLNITGADFYHPKQRILQYSLDGGQNWSDIINRQLELPSLNAGKYHLQVRTKLRNEQQFQMLANYEFRIRLPWYRNVVVIVSVVLLLMLLAGLLFLRYSRQKNKRAVQQLQVKQQVLDLKQKAMVAMLNPHFVFNSINSINYYIHNGEEEKYTRLLTDLSRLIRLNLNNTYQDKVTLAAELEIIELYVAFEKHRFIRHTLDFSIQYQTGLSAQHIKIPSMMLQPFVENAIWHGILPKQGGHVLLTVSDAPGGYISIAIQDDGNGCDPAQFMSNRTGDVRGVGLIQERIQAYNSLHDKPIALLFPPSDTGCMVVLRFPV